MFDSVGTNCAHFLSDQILGVSVGFFFTSTRVEVKLTTQFHLYMCHVPF